jgi:hypothetical protein
MFLLLGFNDGDKLLSSIVKITTRLCPLMGHAHELVYVLRIYSNHVIHSGTLEVQKSEGTHIAGHRKQLVIGVFLLWQVQLV